MMITLVTWQPSSDGKFLIGRMVLDRFANSSRTSGDQQQPTAENILGLKVVGGKRTESGRLGAFVIKVKRGSVADTTGHLKRGDEVIVWNKSCLQDATYDQVCDAILASKSDRHVELVVSRPIEDTPRIPATRRHQLINQSSSSSFDSQKRDDAASVPPPVAGGATGGATSGGAHHARTSKSMMAMTSYLHQQHHHAKSKSCDNSAPPGRLQVRLSYEVDSEQLYVTVVRASDLTLRQAIFKRNPYVKMYLLPDRSEASKRRTKTEKKTLSPVWNQSFVYAPIRRGDLGSMSLELSLWDLDRSVETNNHFIGEAIVDLGLCQLDDRAQWFELLPIGGELQQARSNSSNVADLSSSSLMSTQSTTVAHHSQQARQQQGVGGRVGRGVVSTSATNRNNSSSAAFNSPSSSNNVAAHSRSDFHIRNLKSSSMLCTSSSGSIAAHQSVTSRDRGGGGGRTDEENKHHQRRKLPVTPSHRSVSNMMDFASDASGSGRERSSVATTAPPSGGGSAGRVKNRSERDLKILYQQQQQEKNSPRQHHHHHQQRSRSMRRGDSCWDFESDGGEPQTHQHHQQHQQTRSKQQSCSSVNIACGGARTTSPISDQVEPIIKKVVNHETEAMRKSISLSTNLLHDHNKERNGQQQKRHPSGGGGRQTHQTRREAQERHLSTSGSKLFTMSSLNKRSRSSGQLVASDSKINRIRGSDSASGSFASLVSDESTSVGRMINDFIGVVGPGQIAGRDTVTASSMGDIQLGVSERNGKLEIRIGRTKNLSPRPYSRSVPAPYVKVYLMSGVKCLAKKKTKSAGRTIDPVFNQILTFDSKQSANNLQITVWGDYGRLDHKAFMGCVQIDLNSFDLSNNRQRMEWYRLFHTSSLVDGCQSGAGAADGQLPAYSGSVTSAESDQQLAYK